MAASSSILDINNPYMKLILGAFVVGTAWARLEYKMDESFDKMLKRIDEHILADKFEKQIMQTEITELKGRIDHAQDYIEAYTQKEFIRPEDTERKIQIKRKRAEL